MKRLIDKYSEIFDKLNTLKNKLILLSKKADQKKSEYARRISDAQVCLEEDLSENRTRTTKVNAFIEIARTHSTTHVSADFAKPFDSGILSRLSVQINSGLADDPFAVKLYTEATAQMMYLQSEAAVITQKSDCNIEIITRNHKKEIEKIESEFALVKKDIIAFLGSSFFSDFISILQRDRIVFNGGSDPASVPGDAANTISIGTIDLPLPIPNGMEHIFAESTKETCNIGKSTIRVPESIDICEGQVLLVEYLNSSESYILSGIQNLIINVVRYYDSEFSNILFIDPIRLNVSALGCLSRICGNDSIIESPPTSEEEIRKRIKTIVLNLNRADISENRESKKMFVFHDFPQGYDSASINFIQQLCANAKYYGIIVVLTHNNSGNIHIDNNIYQFIRNIATYIPGGVDGSSITDKFNNSYVFSWYSAPAILPGDVERKCVSSKPIIDLDNHYNNRVGFEISLNSAKGIRKLENIPYGIDNNGNILFLDFENTNFATYICGASRSGKSTLLHTIITGLLKSTHPDNIEIWLVDFGKTEFSRYANKDIPHIRYLLLDNSPELVYDLIDRLTEIMHSRQNRFMGKWEKLNDVPELFVIIDEFSVMSNIIADSIKNNKEDYRIKLQTILSLAAKLGMRFIFSSQTFTNGIRGLTDTAKEQVQQRISLKADYEDIKGTLDLKSISERDELLMEQLDRHYALKKIPLNEEGNRLLESHVLFIPSAEDQLSLFESLNKKYISKDVYDPMNPESFIYKRTMLKDGNAFEVFDDQKIGIVDSINKKGFLDGEKNILLFIGSPQRMMQIYPIEITNSFCENCLMVAPVREKMAASSMILSAINSLNIQQVDTECWTPRKNSVFRHLSNENNNSFKSSFCKIEDICDRIYAIKKAIEKKSEANLFIFIMNYESIMMDMQYLAEESNSTTHERPSLTDEFGNIKRDEEENDINTILDMELGFDGEVPIESGKSVKSSISVKVSTANSFGENLISKIYDARNDLKYILTHGPRLGYHFIMLFDTCGDFRQTKLDETQFRHRILFQTAKSEALGIVNSSFAEEVSKLTNHNFRYTNGIDEVSFRPYLHPGISIDGWSVQGQNIVNTNNDVKEYLE